MADVIAEPLKTLGENPQSFTSTRELSGRLRVATFEYTNATGGTIEDGSTVNLVKLPKNRVKVIGTLSQVKTSALGGSRVLKAGFRAFTKLDGSDQNADDDALCAALDVAAAGVHTLSNLIATAGTALQLESQDGVTLFATVTGGTVPNGATIKGQIVYVVD